MDINITVDCCYFVSTMRRLRHFYNFTWTEVFQQHQYKDAKSRLWFTSVSFTSPLSEKEQQRKVTEARKDSKHQWRVSKCAVHGLLTFIDSIFCNSLIKQLRHSRSWSFSCCVRALYSLTILLGQAQTKFGCWRTPGKLAVKRRRLALDILILGFRERT